RPPEPTGSVAVMADPHRLPAHSSPTHYALVLEPDLAAATFAGEVRIDVEVTEPTDTLVLNALELEVDDATVDGRAATATLDPEYERLSLALDAALPAGPHQVAIRFRGVLNDKLLGFYRSTYTDA